MKVIVRQHSQLLICLNGAIWFVLFSRSCHLSRHVRNASVLQGLWKSLLFLYIYSLKFMSNIFTGHWNLASRSNPQILKLLKKTKAKNLIRITVTQTVSSKISWICCNWNITYFQLRSWVHFYLYSSLTVPSQEVSGIEAKWSFTRKNSNKPIRMYVIEISYIIWNLNLCNSIYFQLFY